MSLDVYLHEEGVQNLVEEECIFIRENGEIKRITRDEWDKRFPDREPVVVSIPSDELELFSANITHNLSQMAAAADLYEYVWRPDENGIERANQLIERLQKGLDELIANPKKYRKYEPENKWGTYEALIMFVFHYSEACRKYPDAKVSVSR